MINFISNIYNQEMTFTCLWQANFKGMWGSEYEPSTILSKIHLLAASVKCTPSQLMASDGSLHGFPYNTSLPLTFTFPPQPIFTLKLYFPPCPQQALRGCSKPANIHTHTQQKQKIHLNIYKWHRMNFYFWKVLDIPCFLACLMRSYFRE